MAKSRNFEPELRDRTGKHIAKRQTRRDSLRSLRSIANAFDTEDDFDEYYDAVAADMLEDTDDGRRR